jgi:hypothetical protein
LKYSVTVFPHRLADLGCFHGADEPPDKGGRNFGKFRDSRRKQAPSVKRSVLLRYFKADTPHISFAIEASKERGDFFISGRGVHYAPDAIRRTA